MVFYWYIFSSLHIYKMYSNKSNKICTLVSIQCILLLKIRFFSSSSLKQYVYLWSFTKQKHEERLIDPFFSQLNGASSRYSLNSFYCCCSVYSIGGETSRVNPSRWARKDVLEDMRHTSLLYYWNGLGALRCYRTNCTNFPVSSKDVDPLPLLEERRMATFVTKVVHEFLIISVDL
jgi:hypothetical protein